MLLNAEATYNNRLLEEQNLNGGSKTTLITDIGGVLAMFLLKHRLQVVITSTPIFTASLKDEALTGRIINSCIESLLPACDDAASLLYGNNHKLLKPIHPTKHKSHIMLRRCKLRGEKEKQKITLIKLIYKNRTKQTWNIKSLPATWMKHKQRPITNAKAPIWFRIDEPEVKQKPMSKHIKFS